MKALVYEGAVLTAACMALSYPGYAIRYGMPVGAAWAKPAGFIQLAAMGALVWPLLHMLRRGLGADTWWTYPATLVAGFVLAFLIVSIVRQWAQAIALLGITVGVFLMFALGRGA